MAAIFLLAAVLTQTNECLEEPCGHRGQSCVDADTASPGNYMCTCDNDASLTAIGGPATCFNDECSAVPCGDQQTCSDPNTGAGNLRDFICSCNNDRTKTNVGGAATCAAEVNECLEEPCGHGGQSCVDADTAMLGNYVCTCDNDASLTAIGSAATCFNDECSAVPCGDQQTCSDPNTGAGNLRDFICSCNNDRTNTNVGGAATCAAEVNECLEEPCGHRGQSCVDADTASPGNYMCTCDNDASLTAIGGPATCFNDECSAVPCGDQQTCSDPNTGAGNLRDFICSCNNDRTKTNVGGAATCAAEVNECLEEPCGHGGQSCVDADTAMLGNYVCTCDNDASLTAIGGPATCFHDECDTVSCGDQQTCSDPNTGAGNLRDFICSCNNDRTKTNVGGAATCAAEVNECLEEPCGHRGQSCVDADTASPGNYICTCDNDASLTAIGGPATCFNDECSAVPCGDQQTCSDPNTGAGNLRDFICSCNNDRTKTAVGVAATCSDIVNECLANPCGDAQYCVDVDKSSGSLKNYYCVCDKDWSVWTIGAPAPCSDECLKRPCGRFQTCVDANASPGSLGDFTCTCEDGTVALGRAARCTPRWWFW